MKEKKEKFYYPYKFLLSYSIKDTCSRKFYYILCLLCCFLVSLIALISNTVLSQAPIIFLFIAEDNVGQIDIL